MGMEPSEEPGCSLFRRGVARLLGEVRMESPRAGLGPISFACGRFLYGMARALAEARGA